MARYKCIQRVGASRQQPMSMILDSIEKYPGAWDSVCLFAPANFNDTPERREARIREFEPQVRAIKEKGLPVQFNIGYVLGHGDFQSKIPAIPRHMVGPEGETCVVSVCPRGAELRKRVYDMFARFARLRPDVMWVDDDFRVYDHQPVQGACFCDECIAGFNQEYGHAFTRAELNEELLQDHFPRENTIRRQWQQYVHDGMVGLLKAVSDGAHSVDPDIIIGLMHAGVKYDILDRGTLTDYARVMMNRQGKCYFRPGCAFYNDQTPFGAVDKSFYIAATNAHSMVEGAESHSEIVICPYFKRGKSNKITAWEAALNIGLGGTDGVTFEAIKNMLAEMNSYIAYMDAQRPFLAELSECLAGHKQVGFYPYFSEEQWVYAESAQHLRDTQKFFAAMPHQLIKIGVPLTAWKENALGVILAGKSVKAMPNEELESWLSRGVYADAEAAEIADIKLGRHALGVKIVGPVTNNNEFFTDDPLNAPHQGFIRGGHWGGYGNGCANMLCEGARPLATALLDDGASADASSVVGTAVYDTPEGGKAAVLARAPWSDDIMSFPKSCQILNIMDWLCDTMPVRIDSDCRIGQALWQGEKDMICFLFSMDYDDAEHVSLRLKTPARAERLGYDGKWMPIGEGSEILVDKIEAFTCAPIRLIPLHKD